MTAAGKQNPSSARKSSARIAIVVGDQLPGLAQDGQPRLEALGKLPPSRTEKGRKMVTIRVNRHRRFAGEFRP
jgi:hypothetical protein